MDFSSPMRRRTIFSNKSNRLRARGTPIDPVECHNYDAGSDESRFSQTNASSGSAERPKNNRVKSHADKVQMKRHHQKEYCAQIQRQRDDEGNDNWSVSGESAGCGRLSRTFDGVPVDRCTGPKSAKLIEKWKHIPTNPDSAEDLTKEIADTVKMRRRRCNETSVLSSLPNGKPNVTRILKTERSNRSEDPLDQAWRTGASAAEFRDGQNFTRKVADSLDKLTGICDKNLKFGVASMTSHRRRPQPQQTNNSFPGKIPRKKLFQGVEEKCSQPQIVECHDLMSDDETHDAVSDLDKRSKRKNRNDDKDVTEKGPAKRRPCDDHGGYEVQEAVISAMQPPTDEDMFRINSPKKNSVDISEFQWKDESSVTPVDLSSEVIGGILNLNLTKYPKPYASTTRHRDRPSGNDLANRFRRKDHDEIESDDNGRPKNSANRHFARNSAPDRQTYAKDATNRILKKNGILSSSPQVTDSDRWRSPLRDTNNQSTEKKANSRTKIEPRATDEISDTRITRSQSKPRVGDSNKNVITIEGDSDEESAPEYEFRTSPQFDVDHASSQETKPRAVGDMPKMEVVRLSIGDKVFRSRCSLWFQLGTREPYFQFDFFEGNTLYRHQVKPSTGDLKELNYYLPPDNDKYEISDGIDTGMTILSFCVNPSENNGLRKVSQWYDGENENKKYITIEIRDKYDFLDILTLLRSSTEFAPYFYEDACLDTYDLHKYISALTEDDRAEKEKRMSGLRRQTRSGSANMKIPDSENKLLLIFPFKVEAEALHKVSSNLKELSGCIGVGDTNSVTISDDPDERYNSGSGNDQIEEREMSSLRTHYLTIREDDRERLKPRQFLNDTLVDFWMSWISREQTIGSSSNVHFFTSHFLTTLAKDGPEAVASWTLRKKKSIDVFDKKLLFVPVNGDLHWSLCTIVNPGLILKHINVDDSDSGEEYPCVLFLDSLKMHNKNRVFNTLVKWLNFEWNRTMSSTKGFRRDPFTSNSLKLISPKVPYQENGWDCGVFVCRYAYNLYMMRNEKFTRAGIDGRFIHLITRGQLFQFDLDDIARIRKEFIVLVNALSELYFQSKQKEKEDKGAKRFNEDSSRISVPPTEESDEIEFAPQRVEYPGGEMGLAL